MQTQTQNITLFTSAQLDAHGDKVAVYNEFTRRLANAQARTQGRGGKPLSDKFKQGKIARLQAKVDQYAQFAQPQAVAAFTEAPKPKAPSRKTKADLQAELAKMQQLLTALGVDV